MQMAVGKASQKGNGEAAKGGNCSLEEDKGFREDGCEESD